MTFSLAVIVFIAGIGVGLLSNILGLGGGVIMVPVFLAAIPGMDAHTAVGSSLFIVFFVVLYNTCRLLPPLEPKPWALAAHLALGSVLGSAASAWGTTLLPERVLLAVFILLIAGLAARTFFLGDLESEGGLAANRPLRSVGMGALSGIVGGATGTGGGNVLVPLLLVTRLCGHATIVALSNLVMTITAAAGTAAHLRAPAVYQAPWTVGHVYLPLAPLILAGAVAISPLARRINATLPPRARSRMLGAILLLIVIQLSVRIVRL